MGTAEDPWAGIGNEKIYNPRRTGRHSGCKELLSPPPSSSPHIWHALLDLAHFTATVCLANQQPLRMADEEEREYERAQAALSGLISGRQRKDSGMWAHAFDMMQCYLEASVHVDSTCLLVVLQASPCKLHALTRLSGSSRNR